MPDQTPNQDITVRSGLPTLIPNPPPTRPPRHQQNTPVNKKFAPQKPKPKKRQTKTKPAAADAAEPPEGETDNGSAKTS